MIGAKNAARMRTIKCAQCMNLEIRIGDRAYIKNITKTNVCWV